LPLIDKTSMKKQNKTVLAQKPEIIGKQMKGFAAMDPKEVIRIATMGGKTVSKDRAHMRRIGAAGGAARLGSQSTKNTKGK
jgi:hypothetical protein